MDDFFTEGWCFDNRTEGEWGIVGLALPHCAKGKAKAALHEDTTEERGQ
jgi:hypothetical protein